MLYAITQSVTCVPASSSYSCQCSDLFQILRDWLGFLVWLASCFDLRIRQLPVLCCPHGKCFVIAVVYRNLPSQCSVFGAIQAGNVFARVPDISSAKGAGSDVIKLLDSMPDIDAESTKGEKVSAMNVQGKIRLENIHFRYPTRLSVQVLRGLSLEIKPGTYIALVGASGSGKSTV